MNAKKVLVEEFTQLHDDYVRALCENVPPTDRKPLLDESIEKFNGIMAKADALTEEDFKGLIGSIKEAKAAISHTKGLCNPECLMNLLRMQDLVMTSAMSIKQPQEVRSMIVIGVLELTNSVVVDAIAKVLANGASTKSVWEANEDSHRELGEAQKFLTNLSEAVKQGNVMAIKLPAVDKEKYKEFLN